MGPFAYLLPGFALATSLVPVLGFLLLLYLLARIVRALDRIADHLDRHPR